MANEQEQVMHPGVMIRREMESAGMSQKELAQRTGATEKHISTVLSGGRDISVAFARKLGIALGHDAAYWMGLQAKYDEDQMRIQEENAITSEEKETLKPLHDIAEYFIEKGYLQNHCGDSTRVMRLRSLLGVSDLTVIPHIAYNAAYRAQVSSNVRVDPFVLFAWQRLCEKETEKIMPACSLDLEMLRNRLGEIRCQMFERINDGISSLQQIFAECGIAFQVVKNFRGAPVQGFIKQTDGGKLILCLTIRGGRADVFWFTLFHEIGHLLYGDNTVRFVDFDSVQSKMEADADAFASEQLIPQEQYGRFIHTVSNMTWPAIESFARQVEVEPFIVLGRLQKDGILDWSDYPQHILRYKWA